MAESLINDWLADYQCLEPSELRSFAAQHEINHEISSALFTILNERQKYPDLLHPVCNQFYSFYKSNEIELRRFTLQFIPLLIYIYLHAVSQGDKKSCRSIETLLISIYNIEVSNDDGTPKIVSFRMPFLAQPSIYHEEKSLNSTDLKRWEDNSNKEVKWGPLPQVESINAQNRLKVLTAILFNYNQQLSLINKSALYHLCRMSSQIVNQGFTKLGHAHRSSYGNDPTAGAASISKPLPRIPVSPKFLLELLHATYFAMFNEFASVAIQAVDDIHNRACFEMYTDVILVTNAVKNSLHANPSGQPSDGPMGISVALTPATTTVTVSKSMITNASFRTKKLPDDLEMEKVNQLMMMQMQSDDGYGSNQSRNNENITSSQTTTTQLDAVSNSSPKDGRKDSRRKWKNWGWKYSPSSKAGSIEEEPPDSPKKSSSSKHSSPATTPKPQLKNYTRDDLNSPSPMMIRRKKSSPNQSPSKRADRSSAGARLCQIIDSIEMDTSDEEMHALISSTGQRPASIHVIQSNGKLHY